MADKNKNADGKVTHIALFGDAASGPETDEYQQAYETAKILAKEGYTIVNGGGPGVMEAATLGAESVGGSTLVVTFYPEHATGFEGRYVGNKADVEIETPTYMERITGLMAQADMFLLFKGGTGTISELGIAWVLAKLYHGHHKPFILVGSCWRPIIKAIEANLNIDEVEMSVFTIVDSVDEVLPAVVKFQKEIAAHKHKKGEKLGKERDFMT